MPASRSEHSRPAPDCLLQCMTIQTAGGSVEDVPEPGSVAEPPQLRPERRAVGSVLRTRDVPHIGLPATGMRPTSQTLPSTSTNGRRVLVPVVAGAGGVAAQQALTSSICT